MDSDEDHDQEGMDLDEAEALFGAILSGDKDLERSWHFWDDPKRRRFTVPDAHRVIRNHTSCSPPEWDEECGNFEVRLDGKLGGMPVRVVLGLRRVGPCSLITMFRLRGHRKKK
jgi:hypothetical protein